MSPFRSQFLVLLLLLSGNWSGQPILSANRSARIPRTPEAISAAAHPLPNSAEAIRRHDRLALAFEANAGQTDQRVDFLARGNGYGLFLTRGGGATLSLMDDGRSRGVLRLLIKGAANPAQRGRGVQELPGKINHITRSDPKGWRSNVPMFARVVYPQVYEGIDLIYYGNQSELEYDFVVEPGADPGQIRLGFEGADEIRVDDSGGLTIRLGRHTLVQHHPTIYQERDGIRTSIRGGYIIGPGGEVRFEVGPYDKGLPLVIDPVLVYSTFLGGSHQYGIEDGLGIAVDGTGVYVTGLTLSVDFPTTTGALREAGTGRVDVFVVKLSLDGSSLLFGTYLGGTGDNTPTDLAIDSNGSAYVVGSTRSPDFPTTPGALTPNWNGGSDGFAARLSADGSSIAYATYLGAAATAVGVDASGATHVTTASRLYKLDSVGAAVYTRDVPGGNIARLALDGAGTAYIAGSAGAAFLATPGSYDTAWSGDTDAFVARVSADGSGFDYATFLGGAGQDRVRGLTVDSSGRVTVGGGPGSAAFPTTPGAFDTAFNQGDSFVTRLSADGSAVDFSTFFGGELYAVFVDQLNQVHLAGHVSSPTLPVTPGAFDTSSVGSDGFAAKLTADGSGLSYATYLGGAGSAGVAYDIVVDAGGTAYLTGTTRSFDFPTTPGSYQPQWRGADEVWIAALDPSGSALIFGTYLGGSRTGGDDYARAIAVDATGAVYITGHTQSTDFPSMAGAFDSEPNGAEEVFVAKLSPDGSSLVFGTYLGGRRNDSNAGIAVDGSGNVYLSGFTDSPDFPTTPGAFDTVFSGASDAFVAKLSADGTSLMYSGFLGGGSNDSPGLRGLAVDAAGVAYVAGTTQSPDFPTSPDAIDASLSGASDGFLVKVAANGASLTYGTYFGGSGSEDATCLVRTPNGDIYVAGTTSSLDFPVTPGVLNESGASSFLARLTEAGTVIWSTYLPIGEPRGLGVDGSGSAYVAAPNSPVLKVAPDGRAIEYSASIGAAVFALAVDEGGHAFVTGSAGPGFQTTPDAFSATGRGFMAKIHTDGAVIDYATRFGPNSEVLGFGIALDAGGAIYVAGWVDSANFPTTPGAFDSSFAEPRDGFVLKFDGALNTPVGSGIIVTPEDSETGTAPVTLGFDQVVQTGATTVTISESAPPLPGGFSVGVPATFYDIATTAVFTGSIEICFNYAAVQFEDEEALVLLHFESGAWADVTTTHDIGTKTICGSVTTLSPFAIAAASLEGSMVGDGAITVSGQEHQFSFQVSERPIGVERGTLKYTLKTPAAGKQRTRIDRFDATAIDSVSFSDMPGGSTGQRPAADSVKFSGNGRWNGVAGYRFETTATDEGESGRGRDRFAITIRDQNGEVVATVDGRLTAGNIQSKP